MRLAASYQNVVFFLEPSRRVTYASSGRVVVVAVVDDLVENRSFEEYVWCIAFETLFPKARAFVCGINDEKFESFPKRRQENESHIDRSNGRKKKKRQ